MTDPTVPAPSHRAHPAPGVLEAEILRQTDARGPDKSICPSEVARRLLPEGQWQGLMPAIRRVAAGLARQGLIDILRHGKPVDPATLRGVIRLRARSPGARPPNGPPDPWPGAPQTSGAE